MAGGNANWHCAKLHVAGTFAPDGRGPAKAWLLKITSIFRITLVTVLCSKEVVSNL